MKNYGTVVWKLKIPKKLYNKIGYYLKRNGFGREHFFDGAFTLWKINILFLSISPTQSIFTVLTKLRKTTSFPGNSD